MRASGILLPVFSLPGEYAIGSFSKEAYRFIDFLVDAGQTFWQVLPIGPIGPANSPYQPASTFAIEPLFLDVEALIDEGLLTYEECETLRCSESDNKVDYDLLYEVKAPLLKKAYERFKRLDPPKDFEEFCKKEAAWLDHYSKFMGDVNYNKFLQYKSYSQWLSLKAYANQNGIKIIGDVPIYVAPNGADVDFDKKLFEMDKNGEPIDVSGCPPDAFAPGGQKWGNPLYDWEYHKKTGYAWWKMRMASAFKLFDMVRIDHFRGLESFFAIPAEDEDASNGQWRPGPGMDLINALKSVADPLPVIAEDLGYITEDVKKLLSDSGFPGMKVMQFAFDGDYHNLYLPHFYDENCVVYTGTHDNDTTLGWINSMGDNERASLFGYLDIPEDTDSKELLDMVIALAMTSKANTCIIPLQDYMVLGSEGRVNMPSTMEDNWRFRIDPKQIGGDLARYIRLLTKECDRIVG